MPRPPQLFDLDRLGRVRMQWFTQRFSDPEIERAFRHSYGLRAWEASLWGQGGGVVAFLLHYLTLLATGDPLLIDLANHTLTYITPLQLLVLGLSFHPRFPRHQQSAMALMMLLLSGLYVHLIFVHLPVGLGYAMGYGVMAVILLFNYLVTRLRFAAAFATGLLISAYFAHHLTPVVDEALRSGAVSLASLGSGLTDGPPTSPLLHFINVLLVANLVGAGGAYMMERLARLNYLGRQVNRQQTALLALERQRSEALLLNTLPAELAEHLRPGEGSMADNLYSMTLLLVDVVGISRLGDERSRTGWLAELLARMDGMARAHGLCQVRTATDVFMAVTGLPEQREDHAEHAADLALELQRACAHLEDPDGLPLRLRIGLATGPAITTLIGAYKFSYDLWGDTVNTDLSLEAQGQAGRIQVCPTTQALLASRYELLERGEIVIRGKRSLRTWWLLGRKGVEGKDPKIARPRAGALAP